MSKLSGIIASVALAFASTSAIAEEKPDLQNDNAHPYSNFITTLKSLCRTNENILLGDTNHSDPAITRLTSDKDVLQAIKDCDASLVLESGVEENEGYPEPKYEYDSVAVNSSVVTIKNYLREQGFRGLSQGNTWDEDTFMAFNDFIASLQKQHSWTKDYEGVYSSEFAEILKEHSNKNDLKFLEASKYLSGYGGDFLPILPTLSTQYTDIQDGYVSDDILNDADIAEVTKLAFDRLDTVS